MNTLHRAVLMLQRSKKESASLIFTLMLSIALLFLFINLQMGEQGQLGTDMFGFIDLNSMILGLFTLMIIIVCTINSFIANNYFLKSKSLELCVYLSNGMNVWGLARYIFVQNFIILLISALLGGVLGLILHPLLNLVMIYALGISMPIFHITGMGIAMWLITAAYQCFFMIMFNIGYAYKAELKDLLDAGHRAPLKDVRMIVLPNFFYFAAYIAGIVIIVICPGMPLFYLAGAIFGIYAMQGFLRYVLVERIEQKKLAHSNFDKMSMVVEGNFKATLKAAAPFILMVFGAWLFIICFSSNENSNAYIRFVLCFGYLLMALMMFISMYFKLMIEAKKRRLEFFRLRLIGFHESILKDCVRQEMKKLFGLMLVLPIPFACIISVKYMMIGHMEWWMCAFLLISYIILLSFTAWISLTSYQKVALSLPEGGERDE